MKYIVAHDFGTSSAKASLFRTDGVLVSSNTVDYKTYHPDSSSAEQDAEDWWEAFCENNRAILKGNENAEVLAVSFSGTYPNCLMVDKSFKPLHRAMIWQDIRAVEEAEEISPLLPKKMTARAPGGKISPDRALPKILWLRKNMPEVYGKAAKFLPSSSSYIILKLTGRAVCDYSIAYGTTLIERGTKEWSGEALKVAGIPRALLPELCDRSDVVGSVPENMAEECHLPAGTKIVCGTADNDCTSIGAGLINPGDVVLLGGTSAEIDGLDKNGRKIGWPTQSSGASMNWMKDVLALSEKEMSDESGADVFGLINESVLKSRPGSGGVIFLPYLAGERGTRNDPYARGVFAGISLSTTREDMMRAVVEGIGFNLDLQLKNLFEAGIDVKELPFVGGLGKGGAVRQIFADIFGVPLVTYENMGQTAVVGAAIVAGIGVGIYDDLSVIKEFMRPAGITRPDMENHRVYEGIKQRFEDVYQALKTVYR